MIPRSLVLAAALSAALSGCAAHPVAGGGVAGRFVGVGGHAASGGVSVERAGSGWAVEFGPDFAVEASSGALVAFGTAGAYQPDGKIGPLKSARGAQRFDVPAGVDPAEFRQVIILPDGGQTPVAAADLVAVRRSTGAATSTGAGY